MCTICRAKDCTGIVYFRLRQSKCQAFQLGSDCVEISAKVIENEAIGVESCEDLNEDEYKILIRAASAIARKRKNLD